MSAFKAYDIRGIYNKDFNCDTVYKIGFFLKELFDAKEIAVCFDKRTSSPEIYENLKKGITDSGADVHSFGLSTTPMSYYIAANKGYKTTVMITASHNPKEYNGLKISGPGAVPVGQESGLLKLKEMVENITPVPCDKKGEEKNFNIKDEYILYMKKKLKRVSNLNISIDCSSGMAGLVAREIFGKKANIILDELDGNFPAHSPNPLEEKARKMIIKEVKENKSDIGIIFDGDADRVMFIDNKGRFISPDLMINVLAYALIENEGERVICDIRSSKSCSDYIKLLGGEPIIWKVGHVFAKSKLRETGALYGGELAGHYYFKEFSYCDSGILAAIYVLNTVAEWKRDNIRLSDFIDEFSSWCSSGEINFKTDKKEEIIKRAEEDFKKEHYIKFYDFDGIRFDFDDWWFNFRMSNTEPYLRLVLEAKNKELMEEKLKFIQDKYIKN
ncbi:MAG: phosphomannomutase/phosphoglucomutase [Clostridia bacterium]|nr:phosphomannomutase/phosphoglucomutase [Clostridia bacterium]